MPKETLFKLEFTNEMWAHELRSDPRFHVVEECVEDQDWGTYPITRAYIAASEIAALAAFLVQHDCHRVQEIAPDGTTKDHLLLWEKEGTISPEAALIQRLAGLRQET